MAKEDKDILAGTQAGKPVPLEETQEGPQAGKPVLPGPLDQVVEQWFRDFFPNSPVARNTECWNLLFKAKDNLKERLRGV